jgi:hypothetical protein
VHQAVPILVVAGLELWLASVLPWWAAWLVGWVGLSTLLAGLAYVANRPAWLGKHRPLLRLLMAPYLRFSRIVASTAQKLGHKERDEVAPGIWVGGWPRQGAPGLAQLDLTAELPRRGEALDYANVPMLDGRGMSPHDFNRAMSHALAWRRAGHPVLVHCAYGHGRSVSVACALLVIEGVDPDLDSAEARVRALRPKAGLRAYQRPVVEGWLQRHMPG